MTRDDAAGPAALLGLPPNIKACLFDLDGVLTDTASVHAMAWEEMFNAFLREEAAARGLPTTDPFTANDYALYVDGKPRADGVRGFLDSREIALPNESDEDDRSVAGLAARKNAIVLRILRRDGVTPFPGSVQYLRAVKDAGLRTAVVSSSANCEAVVHAANLGQYLEHRVDGVTAARDGLSGKPAPDMFIAGAMATGTSPADAAVIEDALVGVQAGRAGGFGFVLGIDRVGDGRDLVRNGADRVVRDLADLLPGH